MPSTKLPVRQNDKEGQSPAKARVKRSRLARALRGFRRVDATIGPEAGAALDNIRRQRDCSMKEAIELALVLQAKALKRR